MKNAWDLGLLLAKGTIERASGEGVMFVAVFETSDYYTFYFTSSAKSPRSPGKSCKTVGYLGVYRGK